MANIIIDLLDGLDLDIRGFDESPNDSLLFSDTLFSDVHATTSSARYVAVEEEQLTPPFDLLDEPELDPRTWVAAGSPVWDDEEEPWTPRATTPQRLATPFTRLQVSVENLPCPTERSLSRFRARGSCLAIRALNLALSSPDMRARVF